MTLWNYLALAAAMITGLLALVSILRILVVYIGNKVWTGRGGLQLNILQAAICGPLAAWFLTMTGLIR
ncbi:membrane protein [Arthrobacter phage Aoka]|nr:membrane protein [Arthrobacter phage Aoka]